MHEITKQRWFGRNMQYIENSICMNVYVCYKYFSNAVCNDCITILNKPFHFEIYIKIKVNEGN